MCARITDTPDDRLVIEQVAQSLRQDSWNIALAVIHRAIDDDILPALAPLGTIRRLANLPAFIGSLAMVLVRTPRTRQLGSNPILTRLARDHVEAREQIGFGAREIILEFLLLRRVIQEFVDTNAHALGHADRSEIRRRIDAILDAVIAECTVSFVDRRLQELTDRSSRDSLTGLLNHQALHAALDEELDRSRRYGHALQVIFFDLDEFKLVNDDHGHAVGDEVLRIVSEVVRESIRESDFAGRMGGDEFVIVLVEADELTAHLLLDRFRGRLASEVRRLGLPPDVGVSAGCAGFPDEASNAQDLLVLADRRLYEDKDARKAAARGEGACQGLEDATSAVETDGLGSNGP